MNYVDLRSTYHSHRNLFVLPQCTLLRAINHTTEYNKKYPDRYNALTKIKETCTEYNGLSAVLVGDDHATELDLFFLS